MGCYFNLVLVHSYQAPAKSWTSEVSESGKGVETCQRSSEFRAQRRGEGGILGRILQRGHFGWVLGGGQYLCVQKKRLGRSLEAGMLLGNSGLARGVQTQWVQSSVWHRGEFITSRYFSKSLLSHLAANSWWSPWQVHSLS